MTHDFNWITSNIPKDYKVNVKNITFDNSVFSLMGPNSRKILQGLTDTDLSNKNFPFASYKKIKIASIEVNAIRITYMGELGWELHFPIDKASEVYEKIMDGKDQTGLLLKAQNLKIFTVLISKIGLKLLAMKLRQLEMPLY